MTAEALLPPRGGVGKDAYVPAMSWTVSPGCAAETAAGRLQGAACVPGVAADPVGEQTKVVAIERPPERRPRASRSAPWAKRPLCPPRRRACGAPLERGAPQRETHIRA